MSSRTLQSNYIAALAKMGAIKAPRAQKKHTPIFQRDNEIAYKQAVRDAAAALSRLWNSGSSKE